MIDLCSGPYGKSPTHNAQYDPDKIIYNRSILLFQAYLNAPRADGNRAFIRFGLVKFFAVTHTLRQQWGLK